MKAVLNMEELLVQAASGQGGRPAGKSCIRFGTVNFWTIRGRANEVVEILTQRKVDLCCLQETRWRWGFARLIKGNNTIYKFFDVGISQFWWSWYNEKWVNNVIFVKRCVHQCLQGRFLVGTTIVNVICCCAPQSSSSAEEKVTF